MNEFANVQEPFTSFDAIDCCQAGLEWIAMDDVGRYNFRPLYNFNVTPPSAASASSTSSSTNFQDTEKTDQGQGVRQEDNEDSQSLCILKLDSSSPMGLQKCVLFPCM